MPKLTQKQQQKQHQRRRNVTILNDLLALDRI